MGGTSDGAVGVDDDVEESVAVDLGYLDRGGVFGLLLDKTGRVFL